jgi:hypothetical protein
VFRFGEREEKTQKTPSLNITDSLPKNLKSLLNQSRLEKVALFQRPARDSNPHLSGNFAIHPVFSRRSHR